MPGTKPLAGVLAAAAVVAVLGACGSSAEKTLDPADAQSLKAKVAAVDNAVASGNCENAQVAAQDFIDTVNQLPQSATTDTKDALRSAGDSLKSLAANPSQCQQAGATGVAGAQPTTSSTPTVTPTTTTPTTTTTTATTSTTTTKAAPPPAQNGNGNGNEGSAGGGNQGSSGEGGGSGGDTGGTGLGVGKR